MSLLRVFAHGVIAPAWVILALVEWNKGRRRLPSLFLLFAVERFMVLFGLALDVITPGTWLAQRGLLTQITLVEAVAMSWMVWALWCEDDGVGR